MEDASVTRRLEDVPSVHGRRLATGDTVTPMSATDLGHLQGRTIIVTGAASGFGRLVTEITASRGANVLAADIDGDGVEALASALRAEGRSVHACTTDVADAAQMRSMAEVCIARFDAIDVLVNNAGIMPLAFWADHAAAAEAWDRCIDINLKGVVNGIAAVYDRMIEQGRGHVVNISSIYGNVPVAGSAIYTATKAAVNILSESLRIESQGRIKVTTVKPTGVIGTNLGDSIINGEAMIGILGQNMESFRDNAVKFMTPGESEGLTDPEDIRYWAISPRELAEQIVYVIDQPWGVSISDITVRASGDQYLS
jgi:NADP-dependent 3-hydroxy acid dehydrogenase YdfG